MSLLVRALVGLIAPMFCLVAAAQPRTLTVVLPDGSGQTVPFLAALQQETARVLSTSGFGFQWLEKHAAQGQAFDQLIVVRFAGTCSSNAGVASQNESGSSSLATTAVSEGQVLPFVVIDCDQTRRLIAPALGPLPEGARATVYARAVGRVLAHELYHVLARTRTHAGTGVAKSCFGMSDLLARRFEFDAASVAQIRRAQLRTATQIANAAPSASNGVPAGETDSAAAADEGAGRD